MGTRLLFEPATAVLCFLDSCKVALHVRLDLRPNNIKAPLKVRLGRGRIVFGLATRLGRGYCGSVPFTGGLTGCGP
jgi:hypothetical protein